ncbi:hypothetical protein KKD81_03325 [Patescibacteria group bacterium]|nr:hypothetical protein [Patescibacteria group bacterium]MBU2159248.1 hypothetical protein [Patescibacteria group bacterium]MBU2220936.1 hypothetical protein [Patescibacteria group bacterium]
MEHTPTKTTARDFFLWAGAVIALYGSVISFITLLFEYINRAFPDPLAYMGDPYGGPVRAAMAAVIVLVPTTLILLRIIRSTIKKESGKAEIWVRKWALVLTLFIATVTILIDLITLLTTFLGGEISIRFALKVAIVLLVAAGIFLHFLADLKGYWLTENKKANLVGLAAGILALAAVVSGFFIIGTPTDARMMRYDQQKVSDLQNIQYQVTTYYQQKERLPDSLQDLADPLSGFAVPVDPQTQGPYTYSVTDSLTFTLCTSFNRVTPDTSGTGAYPQRDIMYPGMGVDENWTHGVGETCFTRTIDPDKYPPFDLKTR